MNNLMQDVRYAARVLAKAPAFTAVAVLTLALGIGANTAVFSFMNSLFFRPLPAADPDRIVRVTGANGDSRFDVMSYPSYLDIRDRTQSFAGIAGHTPITVSFGMGGEPENLSGEMVSGNYFTVQGVRAMQGRTLTADDDVSIGAHPVVVISHALWRRAFGGAHDTVGRTIYLNGHAFNVIGILPPEFQGTYSAMAAHIWAPMAMHNQVRPRGGRSLQTRGWEWMMATARLRPGVERAQAQQELDRLAQQMRQEKLLDKDSGFAAHPARSLPEDFYSGATKILTGLLVVVTLVLLVACANIASVMLARLASRRREIAIRQSLGATRARLARQWLTESVLLAAGGGALGLLLAMWISDALLRLVPEQLTQFSPQMSADGRVLAYTLGVTLLTSIAFGLFPAFRAGRLDLAGAMKEEGASTAGGYHKSRLFGAFIVGQVAASLVLLAAAGLLLRSLHNASLFNPGFATQDLLVASVDLNPHGYTEARGRAFWEQALGRVRNLPGVQGATFAQVTPLGFSRESRGFDIPGHTPPEGRKYFSLAINVVGPEYFRVMGIPLVAGREFDERDVRAGAAPVIVINETMARKYWPNENPVGKSIVDLGTKAAMQIIGVARDIKYYSMDEAPRSYVYASFGQFYSTPMTLHVRASTNAAALPQLIKQQVAALDPAIAVYEAMPFDQLRMLPLAPTRAMAISGSAFSLLALILTAVGMYGIVSYSVSQRTQEMGVRMALGAQRVDILRLIIGRGLTLTAIGVVLGCVLAVATTRFMQALLFGVSPADPATLAGVGALLVAVALIACYVPARRASRVDPIVALRYE